MPENVSKADKIQDRLVDLAIAIILLAADLPRNPAGRHVASQVLLSGTSPAPNYGEARGAESRAGFVHKLRVALKWQRRGRALNVRRSQDEGGWRRRGKNFQSAATYSWCAQFAQAWTGAESGRRAESTASAAPSTFGVQALTCGAQRYPKSELRACSGPAMTAMMQSFTVL